MTSAIGKSIHDHYLKHPFFKTSIDNHLKWIPYAVVFVLDLFRIKTRSAWKKQVIITGFTEGIRYFTVDSLKKLTKERRPAPYTGHHSFPSGHTSSSFAGAEFMHRELKKSLPVLSCTGYLAATVTAVIRIKKNRHWPVDVVAGAAIGILSAKLVYLIVDKATNRKNKKKTGAFNPNAEETGMQLEISESEAIY